MRVLDLTLHRPAPEEGGSPGPGREVHFGVTLQGRAYVRSIVQLLGRRLRSSACLGQLRRAGIGQFEAADAWPLATLLPLLKRHRQ